MKKKRKVVSKETKGLLGSLGAIAAITVVGTIFQFARSDQEFADLDALLAEVGSAGEMADTCNATIDLAEQTKRHMFRPYRAEISALTADQVDVAVAAFGNVQKSISREDWILMAAGSNNLRRLAVAKFRVDQARSQRQSQVNAAEQALQARLAEISREESAATAPVQAQLAQVRARIQELNEEISFSEEMANRLNGERTSVEERFGELTTTLRIQGEGRAETRRRQAFLRSGERCPTPTDGRRLRGTRQQQCENFRSYTELQGRRDELARVLPDVQADRARLNEELAQGQATVIELQGRIREINQGFAAQQDAALAQRSEVLNRVQPELDALNQRLTSIENAQAGLERQLNYRGQVFYELLRNAHDAGCRRDFFLDRRTLSNRYGATFANSRNSDGSIPMVADCLNLSEVGYSRHDGTLQTCRILPRLSQFENEIVRQAGTDLVADHYQSCVKIDLARIDESFFRADGQFNLARVREILAPSEDWIFMVERVRGHLRYEVVDTVSSQLPAECRDQYLERQFQVPVAAPAAPSVEADGAAPNVTR